MSYGIEFEDVIQQLRAEVALLGEELRRVRLDNDAKDREIAELHKAAVELSKQNIELRKMVQSWADEADEEIRRARRAEAEALEL